MTHKQNYCSKRHQTPRSSSPSSSSDTSSRSLSTSPTRLPLNSNESDSDDKSENNKLETKFSNIDIEKKDDQTQLIKSVIYQCNSCLFQTDKKSIMNRHSRVHLAQKRKAMEESSATQQNEQVNKQPLINKRNESNNEHISYCKDCDISFSSTVTYQHHRDNYCQKYKTIEAVVALEKSTDSKPKSPQPKEAVKLIQNKDQIKTNVVPLNHSVQSPQPPLQGAPPGAVQMGDLVYIPVYKVNNQNKFSVPIIKEDLPQRPNSSDASLMRNLSNSPLDLSLKNQNLNFTQQQQITNNIKQSIIQADPAFLLKQSYQTAYAKQQLLYYKEKEIEYLNRKIQADNYLKLSMPYRIPFDYPTQMVHQPTPFIVSMDALKMQQQQQEQVQNKIYHCTNCQQLFFKLKLFKRHSCVLNNNTPVISHPPAPEAAYIKNRRNSSTSSLDTSFEKNNENINKQPLPTDLINKKTPIDQIHDGLLKHPLVKKTLLEMYDKTTVTNDLNKNFFICTSCGYRGNTLRGVKQHGKLHLSNREQFAIINMTDKEPLLAYNSNEDNELQIQLNQKKSLNIQLDFAKSNKRSSSDIDSDDSSDKSNKPTNVCKIPMLLLTNSTDIKTDKAIAATPAPVQSNSQPMSKKARLLDSHYNQQKILNDETTNTITSNTKKQDNDVSENKSQTYCSKCNIQFQHINNYLAHKTNYCKS